MILFVELTGKCGATFKGKVVAYLPKGEVRVCEFRGSNLSEQVAVAMQFLADKGCVTRL